MVKSFEIRTNWTKNPNTRYRLVVLFAEDIDGALAKFDREYRRSKEERVLYCKESK